MKKLIVLLMVMCLALCGCSKEEPQTATPTQEPAKGTASSDDYVNEQISEDELLKAIYDEVDESKISTTKNNYDSMVSATNISLINESVIKEVAQLGGGTITMGPDGIKFDNIGPEMQKAIENVIGNLSDLKFYTECIIKVDGNGVIKREKEPTGNK